MRTSVVDSRSHASATLAEKMTALAALAYRLDTGRWPDTDASALNKMAASLNIGPARFVDYDRRRFTGQWRLHAFSRMFDLSFSDIRNRVELLRENTRISDAVADRMSAILAQAEVQAGEKQWQAVRDGLICFETLIPDAQQVTDPDDLRDIAWDVRLMRIQIERDAADPKLFSGP